VLPLVHVQFGEELPLQAGFSTLEVSNTNFRFSPLAVEEWFKYDVNN
jgi:hypothetical protein